MQEVQPNFLAPRPGLEPGTYGLTVERTACLMARKCKTGNGFLLVFIGPELLPTLCRTWRPGSPIYFGGSRTGSTE